MQPRLDEQEEGEARGETSSDARAVIKETVFRERSRKFLRGNTYRCAGTNFLACPTISRRGPRATEINNPFPARERPLLEFCLLDSWSSRGWNFSCSLINPEREFNRLNIYPLDLPKISLGITEHGILRNSKGGTGINERAVEFNNRGKSAC